MRQRLVFVNSHLHWINTLNKTFKLEEIFFFFNQDLLLKWTYRNINTDLFFCDFNTEGE